MFTYGVWVYMNASRPCLPLCFEAAPVSEWIRTIAPGHISGSLGIGLHMFCTHQQRSKSPALALACLARPRLWQFHLAFELSGGHDASLPAAPFCEAAAATHSRHLRLCAFAAHCFFEKPSCSLIFPQCTHARPTSMWDAAPLTARALRPLSAKPL